MHFFWHPDFSDCDDSRAWICQMPDGSELCVEQFFGFTSSLPAWKAMVRIGENGQYATCSGAASAVFETRLKAQKTAEIFYLLQVQESVTPV